VGTRIRARAMQRLARDHTGPDDGRQSRLHLPAGNGTETDVRAARHAARRQTPRDLRCRPRQLSTQRDDPRGARLARSVSGTGQAVEPISCPRSRGRGERAAQSAVPTYFTSSASTSVAPLHRRRPTQHADRIEPRQRGWQGLLRCRLRPAGRRRGCQRERNRERCAAPDAFAGCRDLPAVAEGERVSEKGSAP
jgi:hypothetical protein